MTSRTISEELELYKLKVEVLTTKLALVEIEKEKFQKLADKYEKEKSSDPDALLKETLFQMKQCFENLFNRNQQQPNLQENQYTQNINNFKRALDKYIEDVDHLLLPKRTPEEDVESTFSSLGIPEVISQRILYLCDYPQQLSSTPSHTNFDLQPFNKFNVYDLIDDQLTLYNGDVLIVLLNLDSILPVITFFSKWKELYSTATIYVLYNDMDEGDDDAYIPPNLGEDVHFRAFQNECAFSVDDAISENWPELFDKMK